jgi:hypothetical protein
MLATLLMPIIRHALTTFGGALASKGFVSASDVETAIGAVMALIGVALSVANAVRSQPK